MPWLLQVNHFLVRLVLRACALSGVAVQPLMGVTSAAYSVDLFAVTGVWTVTGVPGVC